VALVSKSVDEILAPKPEVRLRVYAYAIDDDHHAGLLKIGQTTRDVKKRIAEQTKTAGIKNYRIELDEPAETVDGATITDFDVRAALRSKGHLNPFGEWMQCSLADVVTAIDELKTGVVFQGTHDQTFPMRREQLEAVKRTHDYFHSIWKEDMHAAPRFLFSSDLKRAQQAAAIFAVPAETFSCALQYVPTHAGIRLIKEEAVTPSQRKIFGSKARFVTILIFPNEDAFNVCVAKGENRFLTVECAT